VRFTYHRPASLQEAVTLLADTHAGRRPIAYGTDLLVWAKTGVAKPEEVVDLSGLAELQRIESTDVGLVVGAGVPLSELGRQAILCERFPSMAEALNTMGSVQLREGASLGGNVCTASPAGDTGPPLLAYEAVMVIIGPSGSRELPAADFYRGPGKNALGPGEVIEAIRLPWPPDGAVGSYSKGARRAAVDLALVSVAAVAFPDAEAASGVGLRLALGAVAPTPIRVPAAESLVRQRGFPPDASGELAQALAEATRSTARPIDDVRASADYRRELVGVLAARAGARLGSMLGNVRNEGKDSEGTP
jgi:carbon-monoxide dehydrogenase medium subunit